MRIGVIGKGPWGQVWARTLQKAGIDHWQESRNWGSRDADGTDGVIVASPASAHMANALHLMETYTPIIIEKPMCMSSAEAWTLKNMADEVRSAIVFVDHTRLYSKAWRAFRDSLEGERLHSVYAVAGGPCKLDPLFDWGSHLVAMVCDLGFDPLQAHILASTEPQPLKVIVNGRWTYTDAPADAESPAPLEVLLTEFIAAIERGAPDTRGLELGVRVIEALEAIQARRRIAA